VVRGAPRCCGFPAGTLDAVPYSPIGTTSLDWYRGSADWEYPTALDFQTVVMTARTLRAMLELPAGVPIPAETLVSTITDLVRYVADQLEDADRVMDRRDVVGIGLDRPTRAPRVQLTSAVKTWPAIEGVTVPRRDRTL